MSKTDRLRGRLRDLRRELGDDVERARCLAVVSRNRSEIDSLLEDLDHQIERLPKMAVATIVGPTGAGKSTLLNALAGSSVAVEGIDRPTTRVPVVYAPLGADVEPLIEGLGAAVEVARYDSKAITDRSPRVLVDAPDWNSIAEPHRDIVRRLATRSDALIVVLHHQAVVEEASVRFVDEYVDRRRLLYVLNRSDELTSEARDQLLEQVREVLGTRGTGEGATVLSMSALAARENDGDPEWRRFLEALSAIVGESAIGGVRLVNALGTASRIGSWFRERGDEIESELGALLDDVRSGTEEIARRARADVGERLALREPDVTARLADEIASRWEGPGGWVVRSGGWSSLGLGAGALLARRHPVAAVGAAAVGVAADRSGRARIQERIEEVGGLAPDDGDVSFWVREALGPARIRAARLTGEPTGLSVPDEGSVGARLADVSERGWRRSVRRELPRAGATTWLRHFRLLIDLPVYALGAWVVFRVASGFWEGEYAGVDFAVNAALLAGAYLLPVRLGVRAVARLGAKRILRATERRVTADVERALAELSEGVHLAVGSVRDAWRRLSRLAADWGRALEGTRGSEES